MLTARETPIRQGVLDSGSKCFDTRPPFRPRPQSRSTDPPDGTFTVCDWVTPLYEAVTVTDPAGTPEKL